MTMAIEGFEPSGARRTKVVWGGGVAAAVVALALGVYALFPRVSARAERTTARSTESAPADATGSAAAPQLPSPTAAAGGGADAGATARAAEPAMVQVTLRTSPSVHATVTMGKTRLGSIAPRAPLVVERRRDSGPLDIVVRSAGYIAVHTRVYTFSDNTVDVRLTPLDKKNTLYGYREPLPEDDGGVPLSPGAGPAPEPAPPPQ